jgi:hypothetical protein
MLATAACSSSAVGTSSSSSSSGGSATGSATDTPSTSSGEASGSQWDALFEAPSTDSATPGSLFGRWGATAGTSDELRLVLGSDNVMQARRCKGFAGAPDTTIGTSAKARVTEASITPLETKAIGKFPCEIAIHATELVACNMDDGRISNCFELSGTSLSVWTDQDGKVDYTKLAD